MAVDCKPGEAFNQVSVQLYTFQLAMSSFFNAEVWKNILVDSFFNILSSCNIAVHLKFFSLGKNISWKSTIYVACIL